MLFLFFIRKNFFFEKLVSPDSETQCKLANTQPSTDRDEANEQIACGYGAMKSDTYGRQMACETLFEFDFLLAFCWHIGIDFDLLWQIGFFVRQSIVRMLRQSINGFFFSSFLRAKFMHIMAFVRGSFFDTIIAFKWIS